MGSSTQSGRFIGRFYGEEMRNSMLLWALAGCLVSCQPGLQETVNEHRDFVTVSGTYLIEPDGDTLHLSLIHI